MRESSERESLLARRRRDLAQRIDAELGPFDARLLEAIRTVPRERFVRAGDEERSADDVPLPLDDEGLATVSAPHAYCLSYRLVELSPGDSLVELGSGTGYGAALASFVVGPTGRVLTIEIDEALAARATELLAAVENVSCVRGDAIDSARRWAGASKVVCTFAIEGLPGAWVDALPHGGLLVAPVASLAHGHGHAGDQALVRVARQADGTVRVTKHGGVRYVKNRGAAAT